MWGGNGAHERARDRRGGGLDPDQTAASGGPKRRGGPYRSARTGSVGKYGAMEFGFLPRKHRPGAVRDGMTKHGFRIDHDQYLQFTLLPAPFCTLLSRLKLTIDEKLDVLDRTPLRIIGSCYVVCARREMS